MKYYAVILFILFGIITNAQKDNSTLELMVIKETLPQLLNQNPNSLASCLKGNGVYQLLEKSSSSFPVNGSVDAAEFRLKLKHLSDSIENILKTDKIIVLLSDTLFGYRYYPQITAYADGSGDTIDLRSKEMWQYTIDDLTEVFQSDYAFRGLSKPVDLDFIGLIYNQINQNLPNRKIELKELDTSYYVYQSFQNADLTNNLSINAVRIYRPVFNKRKTKACYLFSFQAASGPFREFVFVEKQNNRWIFIESYGSHHIDSRDFWLTD